ncbi:MAG: hypothetical protein K6F70_00655 [Eggerthellaceae bacterium]|nr:hypothetical protein [Eggerthellaceae bacterium]
MLVTLMRQDDEVLEFDFDVPSQAVRHVRLLASAELAPSGIADGSQRASERLAAFLRERAMSPQRPDFPDVLAATGAANALELALCAGGFSLSDRYWYRTPQSDRTWSASNFYDNAWDPTFSEALLACDYAALAQADVAVPDVTCGGTQRKAWVMREGVPHLLKASSDESGDDLVGGVLASRLLALLLQPGEFVPHELVRYGGATYSAAPLCLEGDVDLLSTAALGNAEQRLASDGTWKRPQWDGVGRVLFALGVEDAPRALAKLAVVSSLCLYGDITASNLAIASDRATGELRLAPLYDLGGSFGTFNLDAARLAYANRQLALRFVGWGFRGLDPSWDYSWCDLAPLEGFGEAIEEAFAGCEALGDEFPAFARSLFELQLDYVAAVIGC